MSGPFSSFTAWFLRMGCVPLGVLWTGCLSLFHLGFTSISSSSLSDDWEEAYEELCSSPDSSLSESESSEHQKKAEKQVGMSSLLIL